MVVIRLSRYGAKKAAKYRVTVADQRRWRNSNVIEVLGHYVPSQKGAKKKFVIDLEKANQWINRGARPSLRVQRLIFEQQNPSLDIPQYLQKSPGKNLKKDKKASSSEKQSTQSSGQDSKAKSMPKDTQEETTTKQASKTAKAEVTKASIAQESHSTSPQKPKSSPEDQATAKKSQEDQPDESKDTQLKSQEDQLDESKDTQPELKETTQKDHKKDDDVSQ